MAFHGVPADNLEVNHINGIKTDNRPENLEWVTRLENIMHSIHVLGKKPGRIKINKPESKSEIIFEGYPFSNEEIKAKALHSRRVNYDALCIRELEEYNKGGQTQSQMAEERGVTRRTMCERLRQGRKVMSSHE
jgi:hypothetical protein